MTSHDLTILGQLLWSETPCWNSDLESLLTKNLRLSYLFYYLFHGQMPTALAEKCKGRWQKQMLLSMKFTAALRQLYALIEQAKIDIIPLKGAYLAYQVYPNQALRGFNDLDILVRKEQLNAFTEALKQDGWQIELDAYSDHHTGIRRKNGITLEPHFNLPNFPDNLENEIWQEASSQESHIFQFTPEMTFLMLCQHNSICQFQDTDLLKLLLDVTFLLKKHTINWKYLSNLARKFQAPDPALLIKAFPEFFPKDLAAEISFEPEIIQTYRNLLLFPQRFDAQPEIEAHLEKRWTKAWIRRHLRGFSSPSICWKYHLKPQQFLKIQIYRILDVFNKICLVSGLKKKNLPANLQEHLKKVALIENSWHKN